MSINHALLLHHGGKREWLSSWLETAGWPIILIPISISYYNRSRRLSRAGTKFSLVKQTLFLSAAFMSLITGLDDYLYDFGIAPLPVSPNALIIASQLAFHGGPRLPSCEAKVHVLRHKRCGFALTWRGCLGYAYQW